MIELQSKPIEKNFTYWIHFARNLLSDGKVVGT